MPEKVKPEKEPKTITNDDELLLMGRINRQLLKLDPAARTRVLDWLCSRHGATQASEPATIANAVAQSTRGADAGCRALPMSGGGA